MFWTVLGALSITLYLVGVIIVLGIIICRWGDTIKDPQREDYLYAILACALSWFTVGIFAGVIYEEYID